MHFGQPRLAMCSSQPESAYFTRGLDRCVETFSHNLQILCTPKAVDKLTAIDVQDVIRSDCTAVAQMAQFQHQLKVN